MHRMSTRSFPRGICATLLLALMVCGSAFPQPAQARRIALVIGNDSYRASTHSRTRAPMRKRALPRSRTLGSMSL